MDLWVLGTGATGTVRSYRKGIPDKLKKAQLSNRGDTATMSYGPLSCLKYLDAKAVYLISTTDTSVNVETRRPDFMRNHEAKELGLPWFMSMIKKWVLLIGATKWWKIINLASKL